jgi:nucleoside-diphosphate-sugar epimerase
LNTQISIIGCGWLGLPLAKHLIHKDYNINGSSTSESKLTHLLECGINPYLIQLNDTKIEGDVSGFLKGSDTVIINIPPGLRKNPNKNHVKEIEHLVRHLEAQHIKKVLYISSTSVYKNEAHIPNITEGNLPNVTSNSGQQLIAIEQMLQNNPNFKTTILRFSGLLDSERHPGKSLSGRTELKNGDAPVNLIHKNDCIKIISKLIKNNIWNASFNASNSFHPSKKEYYTNYCKTNNLPLPHFNLKEKSRGKLIDASKLVQLLNYDFETGL